MLGASAMDAIAWRDSRCVFDIGRPGSGDPVPAPTAPPDGPAEAAPPSAPSRPTGRGESLKGDVRFRGDFRSKMLRGEVPDARDFAVQSIRATDGRRAPPQALAHIGIQPELVGAGKAFDSFRKSSAYILWRRQVEDAMRSAQ